MNKKIIFQILFFLVFFLFFFAGFYESSAQKVFSKDTAWVDSVIKSMTTEEKIAQLFMIRVNSAGDEDYYKSISKQICDNKVGGICFFKGSPVKQALWTNSFQEAANIPILVAIDGEWGLGMRLDSTVSFPRQMTLGAIQNDSLIYNMGVEIARQCRLTGIQMNFAPVADINSNPKNPVINSRSFGEDKNNVSLKSIAYMNGMRAGGILACAKHFPGHGDTDTDSHLELPVVHHSKEMIDTLDLYPFRELINNKVPAVMVAHLNVPSLDTAENSISSLSKTIITDLLRNRLNFQGLVFTDALEMKGVSKTNKGGSAALKALIAGNDFLLLPENLEEGIAAIKNAVDSSVISQKYVDEKCRKILLYKRQSGLWRFKPVEIKGLYNELNNDNVSLLQQTLNENAVTLVKNTNNILPLKSDNIYNLASLSIGDSLINAFQNTLSYYAPVAHYNISKYSDSAATDSVLKLLKPYSYIIAGINSTNNFANKDFGIPPQTIAIIDSLKKQNKIILDVFANPYSLGRIKDDKNTEALIVSYSDIPLVQKISAEIIFGGISAKGKLPVTASSEFPLNTGINSDNPFRLKYTIPRELGLREKDFAKVDSLAVNGIKAGAYPGCVILVAKEGKVIYNKAFGWHTYENNIPTKVSDIFDMASITKIEASTVAIMKLCDNGKLNIDKPLKDYLPELKKTNKGGIIIRDLLAHQAGLKAWIPFYKETIKKGKPNPGIYRKIKSRKFSFRVADSLYIRRDYPDIIMKKIIKSPVNEKKEYLYSDIGFYLMMKVVEKISGQSFEAFVRDSFYAPLGMGNTCFRPREKFSIDRIIPTEKDKEWRNQLVHGDVNDQGAAMMGGVCGHAGLFSNATDLAALLQMLLQKGEYAGKKYLKDSTITEFTKYQFPENHNRRGLGFDKPVTDSLENGPTCKSVSPQSYGHSGFTGTFFWVDPAENLIFIFLSNRVYPDASNRKLIEMNIRTDIQQEIYNAIKQKGNR